MKNQLDIIIPVFNEEDNIAETLNGLKREIKLKFQVIIVYDYDQDPTLRIIRDEINNELLELSEAHHERYFKKN